MPSNKSATAALSAIETDKSKILGVKVGKHNVEPGLFIPRAEAQEAPELSFAVPDPSATYMVVALDLDAPFPSFDILGPILHWIQPGLKPKGSQLEVTEPFVANYIGPAPPPGSSPHRYSFFLYKQPEGFDGKAHAPADGARLGNLSRMRYSLDEWEKKIKLDEVLAANYFNSN